VSIDLTAPEVKEAIETAVEEAVAALKEKNSQLIAEKRKLSAGKAIDPEEFESAKTAAEKAQADFAALQKKYDKDVKAATTALEAEQRASHALLADHGLTEALTKAGVAAQFLAPLKALFLPQTKVVADGDVRKALVGDKDVPTFVSEWAKGEEAKHFIKAPANNGGGATGGASGATGNKSITQEAFDALRPKERAAFMTQPGAIVVDS
jgi:hypothetical protein